MPGVLDYSTTAGSNTTVGGVNIAEGMQAGLMNNALRAAMVDSKKWQLDWSGIVTAGTSNAYTITSNQGIAAYADGLRFTFRADRNNTGAATLNVDSRGAKALRKVTGGALAALAADDIVAEAVYDVVYDVSSDVFVIVGFVVPDIAGLEADILALQTGKQDKDDDLTAIAGFGGTGLAVRTAANTWAQRQIVSADGSVVITNPAGVAGDINLSAQADLIHVLASAHAGANVNTAQDLFPLDITLDANSVYQYELVFSQVKSAGATAHRMRYLFDGTVGVTTIHRNFYMSWDVGSSTAASSLSWAGFYGTTAEREFTNDMTNAGISTWMQERGVIITSTAGTFIPQYRLTAAPGGAYSTRAGSYFRLRKVGAAGGDIAVGPWA